MILQALKGYYEREIDNRTDREKRGCDPIPPFGFEVGKIHFALVLDHDGKLVQIQDLRKQDDKRLRPRLYPTPSLLKKRAGANPPPLFTWDKTDYVFGINKKGEVKEERFEAFKTLMHELGDSIELPLMKAVLAFLDSWKPGAVETLSNYVDDLDDVLGSNFVFRLDDETRFLHEYEAIKQAWSAYLKESLESTEGLCLLTGERTVIPRLHASIKGVRDAQSSGAAVVSFNINAFTSFNKEQNYNAPVGLEAAFEYATALNDLLADDGHHLQIGDATTVFWTERPNRFEGLFKDIIDGKAEAGENADKLVRGFLEPLAQGKQPREPVTDEPFFILGLAPNQARIAVRYWCASTVEEMSRRIGEHFADLRIEKQYDNNPEYPGMWHLLVQTAPLKGSGKRDSKRIPPVLAGEVMRSILTGSAYPRSLLASIINRIRAEQEIDYLKAALIKACLVRQSRKLGQPLEVSMSLDTENRNAPYLLGRLFAILEKTQQDALGRNLNRTIRDGYIASASAAPRAVFPRLLRLAQHHISKAEYGDYDNKQITEVLDEIDEFPTQLKLEDQGQFFIGYYHQRNSFFKKTSKTEDVEETAAE